LQRAARHRRVELSPGVLGWFRHAALRAATTDSDEQSGNFGTLDLVCALRWSATISRRSEAIRERHDL
jgi:hypothetical protein